MTTSNEPADHNPAGVVVINGALAPATAAAVKATAPASGSYTFTANFALAYKGATLMFKRGKPEALDGDLKAALLAASAPMSSY